MDLVTLLKRPEVFRQFLIDSKKDCFEDLAKKDEVPSKYSKDFSREDLGLFSTYKLCWDKLRHVRQQEIFLDEEVVWSMEINGNIEPVVEAGLQKIKHAINQAMLSPGRYIIPARGPLIARLDDYNYTASTTEIEGKYDKIFNFVISEKLRRKLGKEVVYMAEILGRLLSTE